jgi:hypothetical protein
LFSSSFPFAFPSGLGSPFRLRLASAVTYRTTTEERIRVQRQPKKTPAPVLFCFVSLSLSYKNRDITEKFSQLLLAANFFFTIIF